MGVASITVLPCLLMFTSPGLVTRVDEVAPLAPSRVRALDTYIRWPELFLHDNTGLLSG